MRDLDWTRCRGVRDRWAFYRDRRPDAYDELVEAVTTLITGGTVVGPTGRTPGRRADRRRDDRRRRRPRARWTGTPPTRPSTPPASTSSPAAIDVHTHMEMPFGGTFASDTFETGTRAAAWGGVTTIVDFAVQNTGERRAGRAGRVAPQGRRRLRHRLRLPPDHRRRRRRVAEGDGVPRRRRGHHQLQAVHGLPGRVLQRRRPDPAGDADGQRVRGDDHDARRERHRHRRARRARRSPAARPTRSTTALTRPPELEAEATHRAIVLADVAPATCRSTSCTCRPATRSRRSPRRATTAATCSPRPARSTCT